MKEEDRYLTMARISRPRGNRGEVAAQDLAGDPALFETEEPVRVVLADGTELEVEVENAWQHKGRLILKFAGCDTISEAERFRQAEVRMRRSALKPLAPGEYYLDDLVDCAVVEGVGGRELGRVVDIYDAPAGGLLLCVVDKARKELLVPFISEFCKEVDIDGGQVVVSLPEGFEALKD